MQALRSRYYRAKRRKDPLRQPQGPREKAPHGYSKQRRRKRDQPVLRVDLLFRLPTSSANPAARASAPDGYYVPGARCYDGAPVSVRNAETNSLSDPSLRSIHALCGL